MRTKFTATIAIAIVAMMVFAAAGATTFSWFTDTEETDVIINTGSLKVDTSDYAISVDDPSMDQSEKDSILKKISIDPDGRKNASNGWWTDSKECKITIADNPKEASITIRYTVEFKSDVDYRYLVDVICPGLDTEITINGGTEEEGYGAWIVPDQWSDGMVLSKEYVVEIKTTLPKDFNGEMNIVNIITQYQNDISCVKDLDGLKDAFTKSGNIHLTTDITFEKITAVEPGADVYLDLNGKTITVDEDTTSNTLIWVKDGAKLTVTGNGTIDLGSVSTMAIFCPYGELVIENGTFIRDKVTTVTDATTGLFMGAKVTSSNVTINGGYFDGGYYNENAKDIEGILAGTVEFTETEDDVSKRGKPEDNNSVRVAIKDNVSVLLNHSGYGFFKVYGGTFVGANPAWGDEGCMLPTTPNYLRPWSYYQGALLDGQTFNENGLVIPDGYTINRSVNSDGVPVYTVNYTKLSGLTGDNE